MQTPPNRTRTRIIRRTAAVPKRAPANRRWMIVFLLATSAILLLCSLVALPFIAYATLISFNRIGPNVRVGEMPLYGMTQEEAAIALQTAALRKQITLTNGIQQVRVAPGELGISMQAIPTAEKAYQVGRSGSFIAGAAETFKSIVSGWAVEPVLVYDPLQARLGLEKYAAQLSKPPVNAGLRANGLQFDIIKQEIGYTPNLESSLNRLEQEHRQIFDSEQFQVDSMPVLPAIEENELGPALSEAQAILARDNAIYAYDPVEHRYDTWIVPKETLATWLRVDPGAAQARIILDPGSVSAYLEGINQELPSGRYLETQENAQLVADKLRQGELYALRMRYRPTIYIVNAGDTLLKIGWRQGIPPWMIAQANPGIDPDVLLTGSELVIPAKDDLLPLPPVPNKRIVIKIGEQQMQVYQDDQVVRNFTISTGIDRSPTQPGVFQVQSHVQEAYASVWDLYMPDFLGIYEAWPGFMNGIHGLPTLSNGQRLWENILGSPASYGCIILRLQDAEWLYSWAEDGVVVEIQS